MAKTVTFERSDGVAELIFRNSDARNALTPPMQREAIEHLRAVRYDENIRCLVVTGEDDAFCAGASLDVISDYSRHQMELDTENGFHEIVRLLMLMKKPVVAKVAGAATGGGVNVAMACDLVYASEDAVFGWVFANLGVTQDSGTSFILPRLVGMRMAAELVYNPEPIGAGEALNLNLINDVVPPEDLETVVADRARELATGPTKAYGETKRAMLRGTHSSLEEALETEMMAQTMVFETKDKQEGMQAYLEGGEPEFEGR